MTRNADLRQSWPLNTPGDQEAEDDIQQLTLTPESNTQELREQMQNSKEATQRCQRYTFHQSQNTNYSLTHTGNNTTHMVFEGEVAVKLHAKDVEVATNSDKNP